MLNGYQEKFILSMQKNLCTGFWKIFSKLSNARSNCCSQWRYEKDAFISEMQAYQHKFTVIDGNMQALELTYEELKRCIIKTYFKWRYNNMRTDISKINEQTPHQDLTRGLMLFASGTLKQFHTGMENKNTNFRPGSLQTVYGLFHGLSRL